MRILHATLFLTLLCSPLPLLTNHEPAFARASACALIARELMAAKDAHYIDPDSQNSHEELFTEGKKRATVLNLFAQCASQPVKSSFTIADTYQDLEVFSQANMFLRLKRTLTPFGDVMFALKLFSPTTDHAELRRGQSIVKRLIEDERLFKQLDESLHTIKKLTPTLLSFFSEQHELRQSQLSSLYFSPLWGENAQEWNKNPNALLVTDLFQKSRLLLWGYTLIPGVEDGMKKFGVKTIMGLWGLTSLLRLKPEWASGIGLTGLASAVGLFWYNSYKKRAAARETLTQTSSYYSALGVSPDATPEQIAHAYRNIARQHHPDKNTVSNGEKIRELNQAKSILCDPQERNLYNNLGHIEYENQQKFKAMEQEQGRFRTWYERTKGPISTGKSFDAMAILPFDVITSLSSLASWYAAIKFLHAKYIRLSTAVESMRTISISLLHGRGALHSIREAQPLLKLLDNAHCSDDMQELLKLLRSSTFKGGPTIFAHFGRVLAANHLMNASRYDWIELFEAIGHLDVYLSTAKLIKESAQSAAPFCFADYVESDTPRLELEDFWNPLMDASAAVPNSLTLGTPVRNVILTGPNTGGKSTLIKAVMLNALCAQTLGIASARSCVLTPFSSLNTYIHIKDDVDKGLSLFKAEVQRSHLLKNKLRRQKPGAFSLTIIDEMYRGTAPCEAEQASHWFAKEIGRYKNSMCLHATHYPKLIDLEKETGEYENYKVDIEKLPNGSLKRSYKLQKGWTTNNVAIDILKEQGVMN